MSEDWRKNNLVISCCYGILKIVKSSLKLNYETEEDLKELNLAFRYAFCNRYLKILKCFLRAKPNINISICDKEYIDPFINEHLPVVKWRCKLNPQKYSIKFDDIEEPYSKKQQITKIL